MLKINSGCHKIQLNKCVQINNQNLTCHLHDELVYLFCVFYFVCEFPSALTRASYSVWKVDAPISYVKIMWHVCYIGNTISKA